MGATPAVGHTAAVLVHPLLRRSSLAVAALGQGPPQLLRDLNATGFPFENLVVRDLRIYAQKLGGQVHHWRDQNQHEVDVVVTLPDGRWAAFEVKLNAADTDRAATSLMSFARKVDQGKAGPAAALGVITPTVFTYRRPTASRCFPSARSGLSHHPITHLRRRVREGLVSRPTGARRHHPRRGSPARCGPGIPARSTPAPGRATVGPSPRSRR